mgnify:CR=1 FL=1
MIRHGLFKMYARFLTAQRLTGILHHSFATHLLLKCVTIRTAQEQFGHKKGGKSREASENTIYAGAGNKAEYPEKVRMP